MTYIPQKELGKNKLLNRSQRDFFDRANNPQGDITNSTKSIPSKSAEYSQFGSIYNIMNLIRLDLTATGHALRQIDSIGARDVLIAYHSAIYSLLEPAYPVIGEVVWNDFLDEWKRLRNEIRKYLMKLHGIKNLKVPDILIDDLSWLATEAGKCLDSHGLGIPKQSNFDIYASMQKSIEGE